MVKCQILPECFLQNFNMQKFQSIEHSNSMTQGLLKDAMNPASYRRVWTNIVNYVPYIASGQKTKCSLLTLTLTRCGRLDDGKK